MAANLNPNAGDAAEAYVINRLLDDGYDVISTNFRSRTGEIDIVALDGDVLVLVEVKQRTGERFGRAEESVDTAKVRRILDTADVFVAEHPEHAERLWRVDLVAITLHRSGAIARYSHMQNLIVD